MRLVRVLVPREKRDELVSLLNAEDIDAIALDAGVPEDHCLVEFPLPVGVVEGVLERIREQGIDISEYTVVTGLETATTEHLDSLEAEYVEGSSGIRQISHAELRVEAQEQKPGLWTFTALAAMSSMVATAGLLLDSAIVITGAMVLAPFLGSLVSASVGFVIDDRNLIVEALKHQPMGLGVAVLSGAVASLVYKWSNLVPSVLDLRAMDQIASFSTPNALVATIAIIAGMAVALTVAANISSAFAGIAAAAAIVPSASTIGIGIVWNEPVVAVGAFMLLLLNVIAINVISYGTFFALGYRSGTIRAIKPGLTPSLRAVRTVLVVAVVVLLVGFVAFASYSFVSTQQTVNRAVGEVLNGPNYEELSLIELRANNQLGILDGGLTVTAVVASESERRYPELAETLRAALAQRIHQEVTVRVRLVHYQTTSGSPASAATRSSITPWPVALAPSPRGVTRPHSVDAPAPRPS